MPLLVIEAKGEIVSSNFAEFAEQVRARLAEFNTDLRTDEDFDQAAADAKIIAGAEAALKAAKEKALADAEQLHALFAQMDDLTGELAKARLSLTKQINEQKEKVKASIIEAELTQLECDKSMRETFRPFIAEATKGKKNFQTMREATSVARTICNDKIGRAKRMLDEFVAEHGETLLPDRRNLEVTDPTALVGELRRRVEAAAAQAEAKRLREEAEKAKREAAEARAKAEEEAAKREVERIATTTPEPREEPAMAEPGPATESTTAEVEAGIDRLVEWNEFATVVKDVFAQLKPARALLMDPQNISRAAAFALLVNQAWKEVNK